MIRLAKKDFRTWLNRNGGKIVGDPTNRTSCPFCRFLKASGAKKVVVLIANRVVDGQSHQHSKWQRAFQCRAIRMQKELNVFGLRGREALKAMDEVTAP